MQAEPAYEEYMHGEEQNSVEREFWSSLPIPRLISRFLIRF